MRFKRLTAVLLAMLMIISSLAVFAEEEAEAEPTFSIASSSPADGTLNLSPVNLKVDLEFTEAIVAATVNANNISVTKNAFGNVVVTGEKTATVYLNRNVIQLGDNYTMTLKSGIRSMSGKSLEETTISFGISKKYPQYRQISNSDMSDTNFTSAYVGDEFVGYTMDGDNAVLVLKPAWAQATIRQTVYLEPGKTYTARARVKSDTAQNVFFALPHDIPGDADYYKAGAPVALTPGVWTDLICSWSIPENVIVGEHQLRIAAEGNGSIVYIDDLEFFAGSNDIDDPTVVTGGGGSGFTYMTESDSAVDMLKAFGVISNSVSPKANVTRIELARSILKLIGVDTEGLPGEACPFEDVDSSNAGVATAIKQFGIMNGYSDTVFAPDESATTEQVIKTLMIAMGYDVAAYGYGGYSDGYMRMAHEVGVLTGVSAGQNEAISVNDYAKIISTALNKQVLETAGYAPTNQMILSKGGTLLESGLELIKGTGMIEGTEKTYLYQDSPLKENQVCIDGVVYECDADLNLYLGANAKFYYKVLDDADKTKRIVYITGMADMSDIVEFSTFDDYVTYSNNEYIHTDENNVESAYTISKDKNVIYNGKYLGSYTDEIFTPDYGSIRLISSNDNYDTVMITDIKTVLVQAIDSTNKTIYDSNFENGFNFFKCDFLEIYDKEGYESDFDSIKVGNVLSVIQSKDGSVAKIYISDDTLEGSVASIKTIDDVSEIEIGDMQYGTNVLVETVKAIKGTFDINDVKMGSEGTFYLDYRGRLAAFSMTSSTAKKIGYLIDAGTDDYVLDGKLRFKIFDVSGQILYFDGAKKIKVDKTNCKSTEAVVNALKKETDSVVSQLVLYDTNAAGEINYIDTAYNKLPNCSDYRLVTPAAGDSKDGFKVTYSSILPPNTSATSIQFASQGRTFGQKVQLSAAPTIFAVPLDAKNDDEDKFAIVRDYWALGNEYSSTIEAYQISSDTFETEYLVVYLGADQYQISGSNDPLYGIVKEKISVLKNDTSVVELTLTSGVKVYSDDTSYVNNVKIGDYIQYWINPKGFLTGNVNILFDIKTKNPQSNPSGSITAYHSLYYVNVYERRGSTISAVLPAVDITNESEVALNSYLFDISRASVWVYDTERSTPQLRQGAASDIMDYVSAAGEYSKLLVLTGKGSPNQVLIIE